MGCGCGKSKASRASRIAAEEKKSMQLRAKAKIKASNVIPKNLSDKLIAAVRAKRQSICDQCPLSVQTEQERLNRLRTCHKANRTISDIVADNKFQCPLNKFQPIS